MKRFLCIFCAALLLLGLAACGKDDSSAPAGSASPSAPPGEISGGGSEPSASLPQGLEPPPSIANPPCRGDGQCGSFTPES